MFVGGTQSRAELKRRGGQDGTEPKFQPNLRIERIPFSKRGFPGEHER
jgi:hypothetical protein